MTPFEEFMEAVDRAETAGIITRACETHHPLPLDDGRAQEWDDGGDPCLPVIAFTKETLEEHFTWG